MSVLGKDGPRLLARECKTCIFNPESPFRTGPGKLADGRFKSLVQEAVRDESYIICHSTLTDNRDEAICRGFYDNFSTNTLRVWGRIGSGYNEVEPPNDHE